MSGGPERFGGSLTEGLAPGGGSELRLVAASAFIPKIIRGIFYCIKYLLIGSFVARLGYFILVEPRETKKIRMYDECFGNGRIKCIKI